MSRHMVSFTFACILLSLACLLYLDWWKQGRLDYLDDRVNTLEDDLAKRRNRKRAPAAS